jgi:DNA-binding response OmpR family regulator
MLRWPLEGAEAESLEANGLPYLLLVGQNEAPPLSGYRFMDWVRSPVDPDELIARHSNLEARYILSQEGPRPWLDDESGRLTFAHSSVDVAPSQVPLLREFVNAFREVVSESRVRDVLGVVGDQCEPLAGRLVRLRRRVRLVGLEIVRVRTVGYALEPVPLGMAGS